MPPSTLERIEVTTPNAKEKFADWIANRGGVVIWRNVNLSNRDAGLMFAPLRDAAGQENGKPHWSRERGELVTDISRFRFVRELREVKRIKIAVRMGAQGLCLKLTDGSTNRLRKACAKIAEQNNGTEPTYHFEEDQAVISLPVFED